MVAGAGAAGFRQLDCGPDGPTLAYLLSLPDAPEEGAWSQLGGYTVWAAARAGDRPDAGFWEMTPGGAVRLPEQPSLMHRVEPGTPVHLEHAFGYWRAADADTIFLRARRQGKTFYLLIIGGMTGTQRRAEVVLYCPSCAQELVRQAIATAPQDHGRALEGELEVVRAFNRTERRCPGCGHGHPRAYGFLPGRDTADERLARAEW